MPNNLIFGEISLSYGNFTANMWIDAIILVLVMKHVFEGDMPSIADIWTIWTWNQRIVLFGGENKT